MTKTYLTFGYDSLGRMTSITYPVSVGGHPLTVDYGYDGSGNLAKVSNAHTGTEKNWGQKELGSEST